MELFIVSCVNKSVPQDVVSISQIHAYLTGSSGAHSEAGGRCHACSVWAEKIDSLSLSWKPQQAAEAPFFPERRVFLVVCAISLVCSAARRDLYERAGEASLPR